MEQLPEEEPQWKTYWHFAKTEVGERAYDTFVGGTVRSWKRCRWGENWSTALALFILVTILISYILICYGVSYDHRHTRDVLGFLLTIYVCDVLYLLDTLFRIGVAKTEAGKPKVSCGRKVLLFLPTLLDIMSLFPIELFMFFTQLKEPALRESDWEVWKFVDKTQTIGLTPDAYDRLWRFHNYLALCKLNRLIRLYRIAMFYQRKTKELRLNLYTRQLFATIVCFICFLIVLFHGVACIWFSLNCKGLVHKKSPPLCDEFGATLKNKTLSARIIHPFPPIYQFAKFEKTDSFGYYVGGLQWSVMSVRNAGNHLFVPENSIQMRISIVVQWLGFVLMVAVMIIALHEATNTDLCRNMFFHEAEGTRNFLNFLNLSSTSWMFMHRSMNYMWLNARAFSDQNLRPIIPMTIQLSIAKHHFKPMVEASEILKTCFSDFELECLALEAQWRHHFANDFIIIPNTYACNMYYVITGSVDVMIESNSESAILFTLDAGSLIGETDAFYPTFRTHGVKTREACELIMLSYESIKPILDAFPERNQQITDMVKNRLNFLKRAKARRALLASRTKHQRASSIRSNRRSMFQDAEIPGLEFHDPVQGRLGEPWRVTSSQSDPTFDKRLVKSRTALSSHLTNMWNKLFSSLPSNSPAATLPSSSPKDTTGIPENQFTYQMYKKELDERKSIHHTLGRHIKHKHKRKKHHYSDRARKRSRRKTKSRSQQVSSAPSSVRSHRPTHPELVAKETPFTPPSVEGMQYSSPFAFLDFIKQDPEDLRRRSNDDVKESDAEEDNDLEGLERFPRSQKLYKVIPTLPLPTYEWMKGAISKRTLLVNFWEVFVVSVVLANSYLYPPSIVYSHESFSAPLNALVDIVYGMDLFFRLFIFFDPEDMYELKRCHHFWTQIAHPTFLVDFVPVIPAHYIAWNYLGIKSTAQAYRVYLYCRMHVYIVKFFRVIMYFHKWENDVRIHVLTMRLFKQINYILLYVTFIASIFCSYGCDQFPNCETSDDGQTWLDYYFKNTLQKSGNAAGYDQKDFRHAFTLSFYWGICLTFGITADFYLVQKRETTLQTVALLFGFVIIAYYFINLGATLTGVVENKIHHVDRLIWLRRYLRDFAPVHDVLVDRMYTFLEFQWDIWRGINADKSHAGFLSISHIMYKQLRLHAIMDGLNQTYFFQDFDLETLKKLAIVAQFAVIPPHVCLFRAGDIMRKIYVIRRGYCVVYRGGTCSNEDILTAGQCMGEIDAIFGEQTRCTFRTVTCCEIITIDLEDLEDVLACSPMHSEELEQIRQNRYEYTKLQLNFVTSVDLEDDNPLESENAIPVPELEWYWHGCFRDKSVPIDKDPYSREFLVCGWFSWLRFFFLPVSILPTSVFFKYWDLFRIYFGIFLIIIFLPPSEAFPAFKDSYGKWVYVADFITFMDMFLRLHGAYYQPGTKRLVTHPLYTVRNYLTTGFWLDLYGSLLTYLVIDNYFHHMNWDAEEHKRRLFAYFARLNRMILTIRWISHKVRARKTDFNGKNNWKVVRFLVAFFLFHTHIMACITVALACPTTHDQYEKFPKCYPNTWISNGKHPIIRSISAPLDGTTTYIFAFYYIATSSVGCGFGDFKPANEFEHYWSIVTFFGYIVIFTYLLCWVGATRCHYDYKLLQFQHAMSYLIGFLVRERIPMKLARRIIEHYDFFWTRRQGIFPHSLLKTLCPPLKQEVYVDIYDEAFRLVPEFDITPPSFVRQLCAHMIPVHYRADEPLVERYDITEFLFFVVKGDVLVRLKNGQDIVVGPGGIIGSMDPREEEPASEISARTILHADLYYMRREYFMRVLAAYPELHPRFEVHGSRDVNMFNRLYGDVPDATLEYYRVTILKKTPASKPRELSETTLAFESRFDPEQLKKRLNPPLPDLATRDEDMTHLKPTVSDVIAEFAERHKKVSDERFDKEELYRSCLLPAQHDFSWVKFVVYITAMISSALTAYQFSFLKYEWGWFGAGLACDVVFYVKIGITFCLTYYDDQGNHITNPAELENKYLSELSGFFLDFVSSFPTDAFVLVYTLLGLEKDPVEKVKVSYYLWVCLRANRIPRVIIVWQYLQRQYSGMALRLLRLKLKRLIIYSLVALHWITCIFHYFTKRYGSDYTGYEGFKKKCFCDEDSNYICSNNKLAPEAWFHTKIESTNAFCSPYTMTMYYMTSTFTTTAYGDIYAITAFEMLFVAVLALSSKVWFGLLLADLMSGVQNYVDLSYHLSCNRVLKLYKSIGLPPELLDRVQRYLTYAWTQNKGKIIPEFLDIAPIGLRIEILQSMYLDHLEHCYLFRKAPPPFVRYFCSKLKHEWLAEGEVIMEQDQVGDKIYFLHRGIIEQSRTATNERGETYTTIGYMTEHNYFGDLQAVLGPKQHKCRYKAQCNVDIVSLTHDDFLDVFDLFPLMRELIVTRIFARYGIEVIEEADLRVRRGFSRRRNETRNRTDLGKENIRMEADVL